MSDNNYGISTGGGNVSATNIAVGEGATINISGDVRVEVAHELEAIRNLVKTSELPAAERQQVIEAVDTIETEARSETADKSKIESALSMLERATKIGGGVYDFGVKLAPHVLALAGLLL